MLFQIFIYRLKRNMRDKSALMWSLLFSLALGTLFYAAFSSIYGSGKNTPVPVALVEEEGAFLMPSEELKKEYPSLKDIDILSQNNSLADILGNLAFDNGTKMLRIKKTDIDEAKSLLARKKVDGILDVRKVTDIKLIVKESGIQQSILTSIVSVFRQYVSMITEAVLHSGADMDHIISEMGKEIQLVNQRSLVGKNKDPYVSYFYNLIAMMCIMASMAGMSVPMECQANLSDVGARVSVSPIHKGLYELMGLLAAFLVQTGITVFGLSYLIFILKINFGGNIFAIYLTAVLGTILGTSLGFFVGHLGKMSEKSKETLLTTIIVGGGFLSGLMFAQIKIMIERKLPFINRINPATVITDAFYSINMFGISKRYYQSVIYMILLTIVFLVCGFMMSEQRPKKGRKSYASF